MNSQELRSIQEAYLEVVEGQQLDEAMSSYDRNRKRAAQRAAERNAARAAGKTGVVPGVGYVSPRKERETYTDEKGTRRHKSGAKMEEVSVYDIVLSHLIDEGYANNVESAEGIMINMSEEWLNAIKEGWKPMNTLKVTRQRDKAYDKEQSAVRAGDEKEVNKQMQRRIAMSSPSSRRAGLQNKKN